MHRGADMMSPPPPLCPSNTGRCFHQFSNCGVCRGILPLYCVPCVLSDPWVWICMMSVFCVKEADWGMMALVAILGPWFSEQCTMSFRMYHSQCTA